MRTPATLKLRLPSLMMIILLPCLAVPAFSQQESVQAKLDELQKQVDDLNNVAVRTQSHMMVDVEYQFSNLWFAAHSQQWDLAAFYLRETQSHIAWTVRVRPVRNIRGGGSIDIRPFQQSIEQAGLNPLMNTIENKDIAAFTAGYQQTLPLCHACHQAAGIGYLDPHVPERAPSTLMIQGK